MKPQLLGQLVAAVPRLAPLRPLLTSAVATTGFVLLSSDANAAATRLRVGCAVAAASVAFALDDDASTTLAPTPVTRLARHATRAGVAVAALGVWVAGLAFAADALTGVGMPPTGALVEVGAVALVALAAAGVAIGRTDDGRGGIVGAIVALVCFATIYIPARWWWPFTAEPRVSRLLVISALALGVALRASADPAHRARRRGRTG